VTSALREKDCSFHVLRSARSCLYHSNTLGHDFLYYTKQNTIASKFKGIYVHKQRSVPNPGEAHDILLSCSVKLRRIVAEDLKPS
jgi:hypothetical protein